MRVTFKSYVEGDSYALDCTEEVILSDEGEILRQHEVDTDACLQKWKRAIKGWTVYEVGPNFVTFTKDSEEADDHYGAVCLKCGRFSTRNFGHCCDLEPVFINK